MKKVIYLDNAATTKTSPEVVEAMLPYFSELYGNPSSIYALASESKNAVTKAREEIAEVLHAKPESIYFTAGGTEADNWALKAAFEAYGKEGSISLPQRSNITLSSIPASIWKREGRGLLIWMWMRTVLWILRS